MKLETPVDGPTARKLLSPTGKPDEPMSPWVYSAILKAMGLRGQRRVFISKITEFLGSNPGFTARGQLVARKFKLGEEVNARVLPGDATYVVLEVKDGKPTRLEVKEAA